MRRLMAMMAVLSVIAALLVAAPTTPAAAAGPVFQMPFECDSVWHASTYQGHGKAVDFNAYPSDAGEDVLASLGGTAVQKSQTHDHDGNPNTSEVYTGYGLYVEVTHSGGWKTLYAHLSTTSLNDRNPNIAGIQINEGDVIGTVGSTGTSSDAHLHYEQLKNGVMQPVKVDGSSVSTGTTYTSQDPSYTSNNCQNSGEDELLFYGSGTASFFDVSTEGGMGSALSSSTGWSAGWDIIVEIEIDGSDKGELLMYDRDGGANGKGRGAFFGLTPSGLGPNLNDFTNWSSHWTHIVPVDLDNDGRDELLFYRAGTGTYAFYNVTSNGGLSSPPLSTGTWYAGWDEIVILELDGTSRPEIMFYDQDGGVSGKGRAAFFNLNNNGLVGATIKSYTNWSSGWTQLLPVDLNGDNNDELLFYNGGSGGGFFFNVSTSGNLGAPMAGSGTWRTGWDMILAVEIDNSVNDELLFYDRQGDNGKGLGVFHQTNGSGLAGLIRSYTNWSDDWTHILPVDLGEG